MENKEKACVAIIFALCTQKTVQRKRWMKDWLSKRDNYSHVVLLREISITEADDYKNYFRMNQDQFDGILEMVKPFLVRENPTMRQSISVNERLALTLRYLATGRSFEDLKFSTIMSPASISHAILETCEVLIYVLQEYIKFPKTQEEWVKISDDFGNLHKFWNTLGAIDGKHIAIKKPNNSGAMYFNYKGFHSIVLLAVVNARKEFLMIDAGMNGRISDGGVMNYSKFGELLQQKKLNLPKPSFLPNQNNKNFPFTFVADEAFALNENLMTPFSQKSLNENRHNYNKRLSRARVTVANAFGILASRFGVFQKAINLEPKKAETITMACCYLHNFLVKENKAYITTNNTGTTVDNYILVDLQTSLNRNSTSDAKEIRNKFCDYYNNEGKL